MEPEAELRSAEKGGRSFMKYTPVEQRVFRERLRRQEEKQVSVEEKITEIRLVNRAKWLLIERLGMRETDAHRYIEKQAMDQRVSRRKIAESVIQTYK